MSAFKRLGILFIPGVPEWIFPDILIWLISVNHTRNPSNKIMIIISKERAISQFLDISIHRIEPSFNWSYFQITLVLKRWKLYLHKWLRYQAQLVYIYEIWSGDWVDTRLDPHFGNRAGSLNKLSRDYPINFSYAILNYAVILTSLYISFSDHNDLWATFYHTHTLNHY